MFFKSFKNTVKDYFTFSNRDKIPILIFLGLIIFFSSVLFYFRFNKPKAQTNFSAFQKDILAFEKSLVQDSALATNYNTKMSKVLVSDRSDPLHEKITTEEFDFNPNNLPDSLWARLGVNAKTISIIKKYEAKGGKFYKKEDVKKMYGLSELDYKRLEPFIVIPEKRTIANTDSAFRRTEVNNQKPTQPLLTFDLNTVSAEELKTIYGIGEGRANAILKYRSLLGGFTNKEQLQEVFGIDTMYIHIQNQLEVKTHNTRSININTAFEPGLKHPYINKQLAVIIVNYRKMHGNFKTVEEIKKVGLINDELYRKLAPYLTVE